MSCRVLWLAVGIIFWPHSLHAQQSIVPAHTLKPTPKTVAWGYYDAKAAPVLRVKSGDTVEIQTLITNSPERLEKAGVPKDQVEQSLRDRKSTRLNSSHSQISYAVFCLKKKIHKLSEDGHPTIATTGRQPPGTHNRRCWTTTPPAMRNCEAQRRATQHRRARFALARTSR